MLRPLLFILLATGAHAADYVRDIKPLLRERCASCHGAVKEKGDLRLDAGVLIPRNSHAEILSRVASDDKDERMPPEGARLSPQQVALLREWFAAGASFPADEAVPRSPREHWAFQPVKRPPLPPSIHAHPVDAFLFGEKAASPRAAESALLRRVYLDITGLPPTLEDQQRFAEKPDPAAVIDDLLSRPEYG